MPFDSKQQSFIQFRNIAAERTSSIMAWVGAGLSAAAGMPTWRSLRNSLIQGLSDKVSTLPPADLRPFVGRIGAIKVEANAWTAFQMLQNDLGRLCTSSATTP
jgi:hypothetical protein